TDLVAVPPIGSVTSEASAANTAPAIKASRCKRGAFFVSGKEDTLHLPITSINLRHLNNVRPESSTLSAPHSSINLIAQ
ncbi:hypothetical protein, partial [Enterobacter cloacae]|uniref:hypothetical protein n=1 Tax=Enterobacter cloacae TaxID=550 RepID=UPI002791D9E4